MGLELAREVQLPHLHLAVVGGGGEGGASEVPGHA
eukprot:CAMPEP_0181319226 /NCGR_PEP_ID=MMETSP1101-20121128/17453_1 /TAXON_ID=46948 /ORGANISM="Rhodomonas abbreviata, Strain Caron Lab Isolate" /LENGTH=34 /DNA_ID= /DNA_START= /DNA_END= /DNA_ORIENTATION=